CQQYNSAVFTF
nr:immunoglobulin light chain junction region [Macaca mulatta]